ncbi:MAG TPA: ribosomal-processing cysteine protease Prp [Treponema sp.]|nr:ribosomal-processing cysteine protease Prp [Treponema sp.]
MIEITAVMDETGVLRSCKAAGHAGAGNRGYDIVCAAVSVLMRTAARVLSGHTGITVRGDAPEAGLLWLETAYTEEGRGFLSSTGDFLLTGLSSVAEEFPAYCKLTIITERRT